MNWLRKIFGFEPKMTYFDFQRMTQKNLARMLQKMEDDKWFNAINGNAVFLNNIEDTNNNLKKSGYNNSQIEMLRETAYYAYPFMPAIYYAHDRDTAKYIRREPQRDFR
jgi:hypothetical protein